MPIQNQSTCGLLVVPFVDDREKNVFFVARAFKLFDGIVIDIRRTVFEVALIFMVLWKGIECRVQCFRLFFRHIF